MDNSNLKISFAVTTDLSALSAAVQGVNGVGIAAGGAARATQGFSAVMEGSSLATSKWSHIVVNAAAGVTALAAVMRTAQAAVAPFTDMMARAGRLDDLSMMTGASVRDLVVLERALKNAGRSGADIPALFNRVAMALEDVKKSGSTASQAFARLNIKTADFEKLAPVAKLEALNAAFTSIVNPSERAVLAMKLFGRSGVELLPFLADSNGFSRAGREVGELGAILQLNAARFKRIGEDLSLVRERMATVVATILEQAVPVFRTMASTIQNIPTGVLVAGFKAVSGVMLLAGASWVKSKMGNIATIIMGSIAAWRAKTTAVRENTAALVENAAAGNAAGGAGAAGAAKGAGGFGAVVGRVGVMAAIYAAYEAAMATLSWRTEQDALEESIEKTAASLRNFDGIDSVEALKARIVSLGDAAKNAREDFEKLAFKNFLIKLNPIAAALTNADSHVIRKKERGFQTAIGVLENEGAGIIARNKRIKETLANADAQEALKRAIEGTRNAEKDLAIAERSHRDTMGIETARQWGGELEKQRDKLINDAGDIATKLQIKPAENPEELLKRINLVREGYSITSKDPEAAKRKRKKFDTSGKIVGEYTEAEQAAEALAQMSNIYKEATELAARWHQNRQDLSRRAAEIEIADLKISVERAKAAYADKKIDFAEYSEMRIAKLHEIQAAEERLDSSPLAKLQRDMETFSLTRELKREEEGGGAKHRAPEAADDRLSRIGLFIGSITSAPLNYAKQTAAGIEKLVKQAEQTNRLLAANLNTLGLQ
jgi:hypothetical protein